MKNKKLDGVFNEKVYAQEVFERSQFDNFT